MQGSGNGNMRGIIPRAMQQVGIYKTELESKGWQYHMEVSFVEIYNETIRDLLRANAKDDDKHEIKRDANGNTTITDVTMTPVDPNDCAQMDSIMEQAARYRSVGQTLMNERSSRSHSVFTLHLRASNPSQGVVLKGALNLVDLAGSERLDRSGATGDRLRETVAINKSLSALTDVFVALGNKQSHIPFRNSKLTYLLQPALSGDGKTLMLVNLSPTEESYFESVCSLRFASQVNQCELGKPKRQMKDAAAPSAGGDQVTPATKLQAVAATGKSAPSSSASGPNKKVARKA
jgi:kinesin family protein C1